VTVGVWAITQKAVHVIVLRAHATIRRNELYMTNFDTLQPQFAGLAQRCCQRGVLRSRIGRTDNSDVVGSNPAGRAKQLTFPQDAYLNIPQETAGRANEQVIGTTLSGTQAPAPIEERQISYGPGNQNLPATTEPSAPPAYQGNEPSPAAPPKGK
jgi:hypothetical protein